MSKIDKLLENYNKHIKVPWRQDAAAAQRVIFGVYDETDELSLRVKIDEFELSTKDAGYRWLKYDLTDTFAKWMSSQKYAKKYFEKPNLLTTLFPNYLNYIKGEFETFVIAESADENTVIAIYGVGTLFGLLKVKDVVEKIAPLVKGRLLVFFPGSYEDNNYRLLDGYDGWNYLAVPITSDKQI